MLIFELSEGCPFTSNGVYGLFEFDQAKALSKFPENKVVFLSLDIRSLKRKRRLGFSKIDSSGITVLMGNLPLGRAPLFLKRYAFSLLFKKLYRKALHLFGKPDIVHAHFGRTMGYAAWENHRKFGFQYAVTEHDSSLAGASSLSRKEKKLLRNIYSEAVVRIAVSKTFSTKLESDYGLHFSYVPNIVDSDSFTFKPRAVHPHKPFVFVTAGNMISRKRMDLLIRVFSRVHQNYPGLRLNIIGSGPDKDKLFCLSHSLNLDSSVSFLGQLDRATISSVFTLSDCFVLPSASETFGVVFIEAMYLGLPVIATRCGGPESFVGSFCGYLIDVDDEEGLFLAMSRMIENYSIFDHVRISDYARRSFSPAVVAGQILELFQSAKPRTGGEKPFDGNL